MSKKILFRVILLLGIIGIGAVFYGYSIIYKDNTNISQDAEIFIPSGSSYDDVVNILKEKDILKSLSSFDLIASLMKYNKSSVPPGRFVIKKGTGNRQLITKLRSGAQDPIKMTINNVRIIPELAGAVSNYFEADSLAFLDYLNSPSTLQKYGKTRETLMTCFLPDTYEMFWTDKPEKVFDRLYQYRKDFFEKNKNNLNNIGLSAEEAYTLASIVDRESNFAEEHPIIAGVYQNRLKIGERLAADPTVVFALQDFTIRRVLNVHLAFDSPYNTYMYSGLPPGPICMPSMSSIKGVLNPQKHDYIFFCAKPGYNSGHNFAVTYSDHLANARVYQNWLNSEGIK
jgi:UPF0755 protein